MREHLRLKRRLSLQKPLLAVGSNFDIGMALRDLFFSSYYNLVSSSEIAAVALVASLRVAAMQSFALAVAFMSRSGLLLFTIVAYVGAGVKVVLILSYTAWCLIFGASTMSMVFG